MYWAINGADIDGLRGETKGWLKHFILFPRRHFSSNEWLWGNVYRKRVYVHDGHNDTAFNYYVKTKKEVFELVLKYGE